MEYRKVDCEGVSYRAQEGKIAIRDGVWNIRSAYEGGTVFLAHHPRPQNDDIFQRGGLLLAQIHGP